MQAQELRIKQIGHALWLQPQTVPGANMGEWLQDFCASTVPLPPDFLADQQDAPPQDRDWS
ncbi:hypothetical protein [Hydrogenophaga sp.]|uniref:hypothetical protein n=1 Tax=Hydrogenophaga sp. TaxID=1904254 RepID=UPI003F6BB594